MQIDEIMNIWKFDLTCIVFTSEELIQGFLFLEKEITW